MNDGMTVRLAWDEEARADVYYASEACDWDDADACRDGGVIADVEGGELALGPGQDLAPGADFHPDTSWHFAVESGGERSNTVAARPLPPAVDTPNGNEVNDLAVRDGTLYVATDAKHAGGYYTGPGALLSKQDHAPVGSVPRVLDEWGATWEVLITDAAPDRVGGWFVAGEFAQVGGHDRQHLFRLAPDGSLDGDWAPAMDVADVDPQDAPISLAYAEDTLYVAADFETAAGEEREGLAAFDAGTGELREEQPDDIDEGVIHALEPGEGVLFAGGEFESDAGDHAAAMELDSGDWDPDWDPEPDAAIRTLAHVNDLLYAGGEFSEIGGETADHLAALDADSGEPTESWSERDADHEVYDLAVKGDRVYVGGPEGAAAFEAETGALQEDWDPDVAGGAVKVVETTEEVIYIGGSFERLADRRHPAAAGLDPETGSALRDVSVTTEWIVSPVTALAAEGDELYVGTEFAYSVGGLGSSIAGAIDLETGSWDEGFKRLTYGESSARANSLALGEDVLWVGGLFEEVENEDCLDGYCVAANVASVDVETGELERNMERVTGWIPADGVLQEVDVLHKSGGVLYAGGDFNSFHRNLEVWDANEGSRLSDWLDDEDDAHARTINGILGVEDTLYIGGSFTEQLDEERDHLALLDAETGAVEDWDLGREEIDRGVPGVSFANDPDGGVIYVGNRSRFDDGFDGENDPVTAFEHLEEEEPEGWTNPVITKDEDEDEIGEVEDLLYHDGTLYIVGDFTRVNGEERNGVAAVDADTGEVTEWDPAGVDVESGEVQAVAVYDGVVYVGGAFRALGERDEEGYGDEGEEPDGYEDEGERPRGGLAAFRADTGKRYW